MPNSLLDFVMSLVRDPDAAARYAQDPSQAIADAHLTGVTSADVNGLIPVVSESLSMGAPMAGADTGHDANVWASGAATAAFDAFSEHVPGQVVDEGHALDQPIVHEVAGPPEYPADAGLDSHTVFAGGIDTTGFDNAAQVDEFHIDDSATGLADHGVTDHPPIEDHHFGGDPPHWH